MQQLKYPVRQSDWKSALLINCETHHHLLCMAHLFLNKAGKQPLPCCASFHIAVAKKTTLLVYLLVPSVALQISRLSKRPY